MKTAISDSGRGLQQGNQHAMYSKFGAHNSLINQDNTVISDIVYFFGLFTWDDWLCSDSIASVIYDYCTENT